LASNPEFCKVMHVVMCVRGHCLPLTSTTYLPMLLPASAISTALQKVSAHAEARQLEPRKRQRDYLCKLLPR
jgi:hypothetical protein